MGTHHSRTAIPLEVAIRHTPPRPALEVWPAPHEGLLIVGRSTDLSCRGLADCHLSVSVVRMPEKVRDNSLSITLFDLFFVFFRESCETDSLGGSTVCRVGPHSRRPRVARFGVAHQPCVISEPLRAMASFTEAEDGTPSTVYCRTGSCK